MSTALDRLIHGGKGASLAGPIIDQIKPHVDACNTCAAAMEAAGVGGHPTQGHAAVLRRMATHLATEAAAGRVPHVFGDTGYFTAAADEGGDKGAKREREIKLAAAIGKDPGAGRLLERLDLMAAAKAGEQIGIYELDEKLAKAGIRGNDAIEAKLRLSQIGIVRRAA